MNPARWKTKNRGKLNQQFDNAIQAYKRALEIDQNNELAAMGIGMCMNGMTGR
jgi:cytochrome c-type biogenesis protein CcmH/NrfG